MAGHAKNVEEEWTRSIDHLRDMAHQNEESLYAKYNEIDSDDDEIFNGPRNSD